MWLRQRQAEAETETSHVIMQDRRVQFMTSGYSLNETHNTEVKK